MRVKVQSWEGLSSAEENVDQQDHLVDLRACGNLVEDGLWNRSLEGHKSGGQGAEDKWMGEWRDVELLGNVQATWRKRETAHLKIHMRWNRTGHKGGIWEQEAKKNEGVREKDRALRND